jgi:WD40 repeat protein
MCEDMPRGYTFGPTATNVSFSPDGRWLARAGTNPSVWDVSTGQEKWEFSFLVYDVKFDADGRFLFVAGGDGVTSVWDFSTGKQVCAIVSFRDGSWAVTDPEGRYDASNPDQAVGLYWVAKA